MGKLASESRPEVRLLRLMVGSDLPEPAQQHWVRVRGERFRLDFASPEQMVAIEYDGWDWHSTRSAFDRDRRRDRLLQLDGWTVLRFTSRTTDAEILDTPEEGQARWRSRSSRKPMSLAPERSTMSRSVGSSHSDAWSSTRPGQSGCDARSSSVSTAGWK